MHEMVVAGVETGMRAPLGRAATVLLLAAVVLLHPSPADAAESRATSLTIAAPATARPGSTVAITAGLTSPETGPVSGANVILERLVDGSGWVPVTTAPTDANGVVRFSLTGTDPAYVLRARYPGDPPYDGSVSEPATIAFAAVASSLHIYGPRRIVDETAGELLLRWTGADGLPIRAKVTVYQHARNKPWSKLGAVYTNSLGRATITVRPRVDTWYQYRGPASTAWRAAISPSWAVDNVPPMAPVLLPSGAPRPLALPAQRRAVGTGPNVAISTIPDTVWRQMIGRSWHSNCPVGRSSLRYLTVNYWGFDGYRHRGELVVRADVARKFSIALNKLYTRRVPIRAMYLPDRFGSNGSSGGANDVQSMRHDNTSAFNCRQVTGDPGTRSPHAYGRSIDINPWENPFHSRVGWLPNSWWSDKQVGKYAWKRRSSTTVTLMSQAGFRWTYGRMDSQHFDG